MEFFDPTRPAEVRRFRRATAAQPAIDIQPAAIESAVESAARALYGQQHTDGHWRGDLTADISLEADYVLVQLWLHQPEGGVWNPPARGRIDKCCQAILNRQLGDGGFALFPGAPSDLNLTTKAYTALKIAGHDPNEPPMVRARSAILRLGGVQECNSYTRINLSLFGLFPRKYAPTVPPEIVLLPGDVLYEMSSWTRAIVVPLSIVQAAGRERAVPSGLTLDELFVPGKKLAVARAEGISFLFHHLDRLVKIWGKRGLRNLRAMALRAAEHWLLDHTRYSDGLGAIYPSMMYLIMALDSLGYPSDHPDLIEAITHFDNLITDTGDRFFFQPCVSPVWDTAIATFALAEARNPDPDRMTKAADWLLAKEIRRKGDWSVKRPNLEPSGWPFEYANEHYPDIDDTAMVLLALAKAKASDPQKQERAVRRGINWLFGMQSKDGGWAAFDVDNDWQILNRLPFADHNAMLDPTCPDITGRVLDALSRYGYRHGHPSIDAGVRYLMNSQESDGSWYGRWGVNYIYGSFLAIRGLRAANHPAGMPAVQRSADWLKSVQNADGGWGESCATYEKRRFIAAPSTPSQTAWAILGLQAAGQGTSSAVRRGTQHLIDTQRPDGTWGEDLATGTGFPGVFYLQYHLYRQYFPLLALSSAAMLQ